jgi:hypothetical protein
MVAVSGMKEGIMRHAIICDTAEWLLESWGNGLSYNLTNKAAQAEVFVQGDDASRFSDEFTQCEESFPDKSTGDICAWMWNQLDYGSAATAL